MKLERAKGTRDFGPWEKILRDKIMNQIISVFELFGFSPIGTPTLERLDVMKAKFGAGSASDIMKEMFTLKDQGDRELGLRYEFTFPFARFMAMNPQIKMPFKRYQFGSIFRDGPIKLGRYREFFQFDVDVVGVKGMIADAEILALVDKVYKTIGLDVNIEVNNRKLLNDVLNFAGISKEQFEDAIISIDKLKKIGACGVEKELTERGLGKDQIEKVLDVLSASGSNMEKLDQIEKSIGETEGVKEMRELMDFIDLYGVEIVFTPSLARGLAYYTGPIFEVFMKDTSYMTSSLAGGGRYDKLIAQYLGRSEGDYPAVGVSVGFEPIMDVVKEKLKDEKLASSTADLYLIPIKTQKEAIKIAKELRESGVKVMMDLMGKSISKNLDYANKTGIGFVGFLGDDELKQGKIKVRNMKSGEESLVDVEGTFELLIKEKI